MENIQQLMENLTGRDNKAACAAAGELCRISRESDAVYEYFDRFAALLNEKSSLARNRGLALVAANARWDGENRLDNVLAEYLSHITDPKPITSRQCIKALPEIARARPLLAPQIITALEAADVSHYADSMRPLVLKDIIEALEEIRNFIL